jgi:hypothetical protein
MRLVSTTYTIPKRGNRPSENEDHYFPYEAEIRRNHHSVAIADGASEGFLSRLWSKILTISYVNWDTTDVNMRLFTDFCIDIYEHQRKRYLQRREEAGTPLKWFEENLMAKGSFSTLLGLSFEDSKPDGGYWTSYSVGDSCLILFRENVIDAFPEIDSAGFGNNPDLIASNPLYNKELLIKVKVKTGEFRYGDTFYLMTDAIANWFITQLEEGKRPWRTLDEYLDFDHEALTKYLTLLRDEGKIKNDDVTIARVTILEE